MENQNNPPIDLDAIKEGLWRALPSAKVVGGVPGKTVELLVEVPLSLAVSIAHACGRVRS